MSNDIRALHGHLFETLAALRDKNNPMEIERAKAITDVAQTIINTAKVEVDFMRVNGNVDTQFFHKPEAPQLSPAKKTPEREELPPDSTLHQTTSGGNVTIDHRNGQRILTHKIS